MFISKKNRIAVYSYLFKEGVLVCKKDRFHAFKEGKLEYKRDEIEVSNLEVMMLMKSLKSRGYTRETFNWQYMYYYLTNEGIEYLREYLHLPAEIVPSTLKKLTAARPPARAAEGPPREGPPRGDREGGYRREGGGGGGFGRGGGGGGGAGFGRGGP